MATFRAVCRLPERFALDRNGRLHIGCPDCAFLVLCPHECNSECVPHETVDRPTPLLLLPHDAHPEFDERTMQLWDPHLGVLT